MSEEQQIAATPDPPYTAVIFRSVRSSDTAGYAEVAIEMERLAAEQAGSGGDIGDIFELGDAFSLWLQRWKQRLDSDGLDATKRQAAMFAVNPVYIPRNHLVEEAIQAAERQQDFEPFNKLMDILVRPFEFDQSMSRYALPPRPEQVVTQTFCGT